MQMFDAGGFPVAGSYPAYEDEEVAALWHVGDNPAAYTGRAVKMVDPWRWRTAHRGAKVIYCTRDETEQAKSQLKFGMVMAGYTPDLSRDTVRRMRAVLRQDDRRARAWLIARASDWLDFPFEKSINDPAAAAASLDRFLGGGLDCAAMAAAVRSRTDKCHPSLFEAELIGGLAA
jgi:hypothetical protein